MSTLLRNVRQAKLGGRKTVVTLSSSMAQLERLAVDARVPGKPLGPFDTAQFAYKVSKTGLNQGTAAHLPRPRYSGRPWRYSKRLWYQSWPPRLRCPFSIPSHCSTSSAWRLQALLPRQLLRTGRSSQGMWLPAVTVQLANELKGEGFTFIAIHPGETLKTQLAWNSRCAPAHPLLNDQPRWGAQQWPEAALT